MKPKILFSALFALAIAAIPLSAAVQAPGTSTPSANAPDPAAAIRGTVQSVDLNANSVKVKASATELMVLKAGENVMLSTAAPGQSGTVVQVSGDLVTIRMTDASGLQSGEPVRLVIGSPDNNEQGLGAAPSSSSGGSTAMPTAAQASGANGAAETGITSLTVSSMDHAAGTLTLRGADKQTLATLKSGDPVWVSPLPSSTTLSNASAQGENQWMAKVVSVDPSTFTIEVSVSDAQALANLKTGETVNFSWNGPPSAVQPQDSNPPVKPY